MTSHDSYESQIEAIQSILAAAGLPHRIIWADDISEPGYGNTLVLADWDTPGADSIAMTLEREHGCDLGNPSEWIECGTCGGMVSFTSTHDRWRPSYDYPCDGEIVCAQCLKRHAHLRAAVIELMMERDHRIGHLIDPEHEGMACLYTAHYGDCQPSPAKVGEALEAAGLDRWAYSYDSSRGYTRFQVWAYPNDLDGIAISSTLGIPGLAEGIARAMLEMTTA